MSGIRFVVFARLLGTDRQSLNSATTDDLPGIFSAFLSAIGRAESLDGARRLMNPMGQVFVFGDQPQPAFDGAVQLRDEACAAGLRVALSVTCGPLEDVQGPGGPNLAGDAINRAARMVSLVSTEDHPPERNGSADGFNRIAVDPEAFRKVTRACGDYPVNRFSEEISAEAKRIELELRWLKSPEAPPLSPYSPSGNGDRDVRMCMATAVVVDLERYSDLPRADQAIAINVLESQLSRVLRAQGLRPLVHPTPTGDGFVALFENACNGWLLASRLFGVKIPETQVRIGVALDSIAETSHGWMGEAVSLADRYSGLATPDAIAVSAELWREHLDDADRRGWDERALEGEEALLVTPADRRRDDHELEFKFKGSLTRDELLELYEGVRELGSRYPVEIILPTGTGGGLSELRLRVGKVDAGNLLHELSAGKLRLPHITSVTVYDGSGLVQHLDAPKPAPDGLKTGVAVKDDWRTNLALIEVEGSDGRFRRGSGILLDASLVMTARHVLYPSQITVEVRRIRVLVWRLDVGKGGQFLDCGVIERVWNCGENPEAAQDVALLRIDRALDGVAKLPLLTEESQDVAWVGAGFPCHFLSRDKWRLSPLRQQSPPSDKWSHPPKPWPTMGKLFPIISEVWHLHVHGAPEDPDTWDGFSGSPCVLGGKLAAVVRGNSRERGARVLVATPVTDLVRSRVFCRHVGVEFDAPKYLRTVADSIAKAVGADPSFHRHLEKQIAGTWSDSSGGLGPTVAVQREPGELARALLKLPVVEALRAIHRAQMAVADLPGSQRTALILLARLFPALADAGLVDTVRESVHVIGKTGILPVAASTATVVDIVLRQTAFGKGLAFGTNDEGGLRERRHWSAKVGMVERLLPLVVNELEAMLDLRDDDLLHGRDDIDERILRINSRLEVRTDGGPPFFITFDQSEAAPEVRRQFQEISERMPDLAVVEILTPTPGASEEHHRIEAYVQQILTGRLPAE